MSKVLVIFIIVLASYLAFDKFTREDNIADATDKELSMPNVQPSVKSGANKVKPEPVYEVEQSAETEVINSEFIEGVYVANLDQKDVKASLRFTFKDDGTFIDYRDMTFPKSIAGETTGTYSIDGALLTLVYTDIRDVEVFKFPKTEMSLHKDGTLRTGTIVLTKQ
jgi:hypothetical protein